MIKSSVSLAWRFFIKRRARAFFAVCGVSLGMMLLTVSLIMIQTLEQSVAQSTIKKYGDYNMSIGYLHGTDHLTSAEVQQISQMPEVKDVTRIWYPYLDENLSKDKRYQEVITLPTYIGLEPDILKMDPYARIAEGSFPKENEVVFSHDYMVAHHLKVGSEITLPFPPNGHKKVRISGSLKKHEKVTNMAIFDRKWLLKATGTLEDKTTVLFLQLLDRESKESVAMKLKEDYPKTRVDSRNYIDKEQDNLSGIKPIVQGLMVTAMIASILIVISTLQISIREKQKVLATLRLLGADGNQLLKLIIFESLFISFSSAMIGSGLGIILTYLLKKTIENIMGIPMIGIILPWGQIGLCGLLFILLISLSAVIPGFKARRLSPIAAYQQSSQEIVGQVKSLYNVLVLILMIGLVILSILNRFIYGSIWIDIVCGIGFFLTVAISFPWLLQMIVKIVNIILRPFLRTEGKLAGRNALRQMRKSTYIAGVLMLAITVGCVGTMVLESILAQAEQDLAEEFPVHFVVKSPEQGSNFSPYLSQKIEQMKQVESVAIQESPMLISLNLKKTNFQWQFFNVNGQKQIMISLKGLDFGKANHLTPTKVISGTTKQEALKNNGVLLNEKAAKQWGYQVGDEIQLAKFDDVFAGKQKEYKKTSLKVVGIIQDLPLEKKVEYQIYTDPDVLKKEFGSYQTKTIYFQIPDRNQKNKVIEEIESIMQNGFSNVLLYDREEELKTLYQQFQQRWFILFSAITSMVILSLLGLFNSMASSLRERIREFGILRALGSTPSQQIRVVIIEGAIINLAGGIAGVCTGVFLGYQLLHALEAQVYIFPVFWVVGGILLSPFLGIVVTLPPATWVLKQDLLRTLQQD
jgi:putative ABC transport system permease protein